MTADNSLFVDIVVAVIVAFIGGFAAHLLKLPLILGYLVAGVLIGPHVIGIITTTEEVTELAEFGVVLLLFAVGVEISFRDLKGLGPRLVIIAIAQIVLTVAAGFGLGYGLGWDWDQSLLLGFMISLSSTMVVLKTLSDRGELRSLHGRILTGVMLIQDLAFVLMIAFVEGLSDGNGLSATDLAVSFLRAGTVLVLLLVLGPLILPRILKRLALVGSSELFVLSLLAITFAAAALTQQFGLSVAVGAFLAGLAISGSDLGYRALSETVPLKDVFGALFFVSLGMLADPASVAESPWTLVAIIGAVVGLKFVLLSGLASATGYLPYVAVLTGLGASQMGEFSFVLAERAAAHGVIDEDLLSLLVMSAVVTMAVTPGLLSLGTRTLDVLGRSYPSMRPYRVESLEQMPVADHLHGHAVIAGLGRVGTLVADTFVERDLPFIGIDLDPRVVDDWKAKGRKVINGSASSEHVLAAAGVAEARLLIVATGEQAAGILTAEHARRMNQSIDIVVRSHWVEEFDRLRAVGVNEIVVPENEAGLEIVRHSLLRFNVRLAEAEREVESLRAEVQTDEQLLP